MHYPAPHGNKQGLGMQAGSAVQSTDAHKQESIMHTGSNQDSVSKNDSITFLLGLMSRVEKMEKQLQVIESKSTEPPKRNKKLRRKAKEVPRMYQCNIGNCERQYGSITSLKNHRSIKHGIRVGRSQPLQ